MKKLLFSAAVLGLFVAAPASAQDTMMKCDAATMTKMRADMGAMNDPAMKANQTMAMKHLDMADAAMKNNQMDDCAMQLNNAQMGMMMKCDDASMMKMQARMDALSDPAMKANKDMMMEHMNLAKTAMKDNKPDECMMHMGEAMGSMNKKM